MKKCLKFFCIILWAIIFVSCSWFNNAPVQPLPLFPQLNTFTITGNLTTNGAMPENFAQVINSRTALAPAPSGQTILYKVLLLAHESDETPIAGATSEVADDASSYVIKYTGTSTTAARYWLRAVAYYMDGTNEVDILVSPDTQLDTDIDLKGGVFTKDLEMRPATTGYGSASLTITLASATMYVTISDTTHFQVAKSGTTVTITHKAAAVDNPKVACGSYPVTVNFYKAQTVNSVDTDVLVYQFDDVINIFNNLTTTVWVDNGNSPHLTTNAGVTTCSITDAMLASFASTNFYVNSSWTGAQNGTFAEPFDSLAFAINYINTIGNSTTTYTIHVKENNDVEYGGSATININKKIKIEVYKAVPGKKDGIYTLSGNNSVSLLTISANGELTLESDGVSSGTGYPDGATHGLMLKSNYLTTSCLLSVSGKLVMHGGLVAGRRTGGMVNLQNSSSAIFEMYGGAVTENTKGPGICFENATNGILKIAKKTCIYGNTDTSSNPKNVVLPSGKKIQIVGPLEEGALIGVTTADPPTATEPVQITTGYGYQTGGYNAGQLPGKYFRGDVYGVTEDGDPTSGEVVLKLSGGTLTTKIRDDITIDIDHTNASNNAADRIFTFTVTKDKGAVAPATSTDLTSAEGISFSYKLMDHADTVVNPAAPATPYYTPSANTLTFNTNLPAGRFVIAVEVTWQGNKYQATFDVGYVKVDVPSGCVAVMGRIWSSSTTLCAGDTLRESKLFIANRNLTIPNIIASDHEVTQTEWEQYMTYDPANTYVVAQSGADKDVYPVYYIDWYGMIVYCNLRTLGDSTFGSTRAERLTHCAYSLNGSKDPESWLNSVISGTRIYKIGEKYYYKCYRNETDDNVENGVLSPNSSGSGIQLDLNADGWRLPTAVEWEYLARDGNLIPETQTIYAGSNSADEVYNSERPHEIRTLKPNALKIYDLSGNVEEWLWDRTNDSPEIQTTTPITGKSYAGHDNGKKRCIGRPGDPINLYLPSFVNRGYKWTQGFRVVRTVIQ